jgi:peptide/nickel transport system permease protein
MRAVGRKLGFYLVTTWAAITVNFAIPRLMPGNAVDGFLGRIGGRLSGRALKALTVTLGANTHKSLFSQYLSYLDSIAHFRFGTSLTYFPESVSTVIGQSLPWTLVLVGVSTIIAFVVGTVLGVLAGWRHGHKLDEVLTPFGAFISSMPYFWFGLIVVAVFAIDLGWFPSYGGYDPTQTIGFNGAFLSSAFTHAVLPATTIVVTAMGAWLVGMRNMMVNTIGEDYITIARAKGLSGSAVMWRYAARNALLPNVAGFALSLGFVVAGAILTEVVFSYPGIGDVLYQAIANRDYPLMQAVFLIITLAVLAANLIADIAYVWLDPRARQGGRA